VRGDRDGPNLLVTALGAATVVAVAITAPFAGHELYNEQRSFRLVGLDRSLTREQFHDRARDAMLRHPADPYFPFVGAVRATVVRDESVLPWAARALEQSPVYGRVHLLVARSLFGRSPSQARLEYRIACMQDRQVCAPEEATRLVGGYDDAMELVPEGAEGLPVLRHLASALERRLPATAVRLDREISARDARVLDPVVRAAARALGDVKDGEPWCVDAAKDAKEGEGGCLAEGLAAAARLRAAAPSLCEGHAITAELRVAAGEVDAALAELDASLEEVTERSPCARRLVGLAARAGHPARLDAAIDRLLKLGCETPAECVNNLTFAADVEARRGGARRALALVKKALEREPERDDLLADVASKAEALGVHGEALDAYTKLSDRHPDVPQWRDAVARERQAVTRGVFQGR
jgi:tetratricopeptide (TPR) repeat protein